MKIIDLQSLLFARLTLSFLFKDIWTDVVFHEIFIQRDLICGYDSSDFSAPAHT